MSQTCGVFYIPLDVIAFESKLSEEEIDKSLQELEVANFLYYSRESEEIVIYNYPRYNIRNMGKPMIDCISKELALVKDRKLISRIIDSLKDYKENMGDEIKADLIDSMISVYSNFVPDNEKPKNDDLEIVVKGKTIIKEKNTNNSTNTNTYTNNDTLDHSCHDTSNDTSKKVNKVEIDWANKDPNEKF